MAHFLGARSSNVGDAVFPTPSQLLQSKPPITISLSAFRFRCRCCSEMEFDLPLFELMRLIFLFVQPLSPFYLIENSERKESRRVKSRFVRHQDSTKIRIHRLLLFDAYSLSVIYFSLHVMCNHQYKFRKITL